MKFYVKNDIDDIIEYQVCKMYLITTSKTTVTHQKLTNLKQKKSLSTGTQLTFTQISIKFFLLSQIFTRDKKSWMGGATLPANNPLQNDNPIKKEDTKNVPPGTVFVTNWKKKKEEEENREMK